MFVAEWPFTVRQKESPNLDAFQHNEVVYTLVAERKT